MPESSERLRIKYFKRDNEDNIVDDGIEECEQIILKHGGTVNIPSIGIIKLPGGIALTEELNDAIDFLCDEWDYALI